MNQNVLQNDIDFYEKSKVNLLKHHLGKFVVIYNGKFVNAFDSLDNAADYAITNFGKGPYLIRQVGKEEGGILPDSVIYQYQHAIN